MHLHQSAYSILHCDYEIRTPPYPTYTLIWLLEYKLSFYIIIINIHIYSTIYKLGVSVCLCVCLYREQGVAHLKYHSFLEHTVQSSVCLSICVSVINKKKTKNTIEILTQKYVHRTIKIRQHLLHVG